MTGLKMIGNFTSVCTNSVFWLGLKQDIAVGSEMGCLPFFLSFFQYLEKDRCI